MPHVLTPVHARRFQCLHVLTMVYRCRMPCRAVLCRLLCAALWCIVLCRSSQRHNHHNRTTRLAAVSTAHQPVNHPGSQQQLTAALQQVQQLQADQAAMWTQSKQQAQALEQALADRHAAAAEREAAWAQLDRVQQLVQQQTAGLGQQQQQQLVQQRSWVQRESQHHQQQQQLECVDEQQQQQVEASDALDAFVVETHMVGGGGDTHD